MRSILRPVAISLVVSVATLVGLSTPVTAKEPHHAKVSMGDARAKALGFVPGVLIAEELEHERGRWIYSFEIRPKDEKGSSIKEVNIDADSGALVGAIETEKD